MLSTAYAGPVGGQKPGTVLGQAVLAALLFPECRDCWSRLWSLIRGRGGQRDLGPPRPAPWGGLLGNSKPTSCPGRIGGEGPMPVAGIWGMDLSVICGRLIGPSGRCLADRSSSLQGRNRRAIAARSIFCSQDGIYRIFTAGAWAQATLCSKLRYGSLI
jgi:hypothetical protein